MGFLDLCHYPNNCNFLGGFFWDTFWAPKAPFWKTLSIFKKKLGKNPLSTKYLGTFFGLSTRYLDKISEFRWVTKPQVTTLLLEPSPASKPPIHCFWLRSNYCPRLLFSSSAFIKFVSFFYSFHCHFIANLRDSPQIQNWI